MSTNQKSAAMRAEEVPADLQVTASESRSAQLPEPRPHPRIGTESLESRANRLKSHFSPREPTPDEPVCEVSPAGGRAPARLAWG